MTEDKVLSVAVRNLCNNDINCIQCVNFVKILMWYNFLSLHKRINCMVWYLSWILRDSL